MNRVADDELSRLDKAFAGNLLLSTFSPEVRALIEPFGEVVELKLGETVQQRGHDVTGSLFPFGGTMVSLILDLDGSRTVEAASIGREGAVGGIISCGHAPAFAHARVQIAGPALRVQMPVLEDAKKRSAFLGNLFCRYSDFLLAQVMQSVACNAFHPIQERAARWLLTAQDRAGDRIALTQETLAGLLGVQRTTVNAVVRSLQDEGLIAVRRGAVSVVDRARLKPRACECYDILARHFADVIGPGGSGAGSSS